MTESLSDCERFEMSELVKLIAVVDAGNKTAYINPNFITCIRFSEGHYHVGLVGSEAIVLTEEAFKTFRPKLVFV